MHGIKILLGSVLRHDVNIYDIITLLLNISVNNYIKISKDGVLYIAHSYQHIYVIK